MMTRFFRWLGYKVQWAMNYENSPTEEEPIRSGPYPFPSTNSTIGSGRGMRANGGHEYPETMTFNITVARGGVIVNMTQYDCRKDEHNQSLYVLHDGDDIGKQIGDIVGLELLKR